MMSPENRNTSAMPRASPSPSSQPHVAWPPSDSMYGMIQNCAIGAMRNAVTGAAADSIAAANPKTRPWRWNGTTFWITVCSDASTTGMIDMYAQMPRAYSTHHSRIVKSAPSTPMPITTRSIVRIGFLPSPNFAITRPPMMKPVAVTPSTIPQTSTEKIVRPYGSMSAM